MEDIEALLANSLNDFLDPAHQAWQDAAVSGLEGDCTELFANLNEVEKLCADIHRSIDQAVDVITHRHPMLVDDVRRHNRKIFNRLVSLEDNVS